MTESPDTQLHARCLRLGASHAEADELVIYARHIPPNVEASHLPLRDEPFVAAWEGYLHESQTQTLADTLRQHLVQLQFPVRQGMSEREDYRLATRRGLLPLRSSSDSVLPLVQPELLQLSLHETAAGRIPVIAIEHRDDFVALYRALAHRNEPVPVPPSLGACMIAGYVNWNRVAAYRASWQAMLGRSPSPAEWAAELVLLQQRKELFQDRFILLSSGPYSATPGVAMALDDIEWHRLSLLIRREHECTHYFTKRVMGSMRQSLLDELMADYAGIVVARGSFQAGWLMQFMGLERFPAYRAGGRLENYRGTPLLSNGAFRVLQLLLERAACTLQSFDDTLPRTTRGLMDRAVAVLAIARVGLAGLTSDNGATLLATEYATLREAGMVAAA